MKKQKLLLIPILGMIILAMVSCQKKPEASFTTNKTRDNAGEAIIFTNTSKDAHDFEWNFGDNTTSTEENPTHFYNTPGTYNVVMKASSKNGKKSNEASSIITITGGNMNYDNHNYTLAKGYLVSFGEESGLYQFAILLIGNGITFLPDNGISGTGDYLILDEMYSPSSADLSSGTYNFIDSESAYTFSFGETGFNYNWDTEEGIYYDATGGNAIISKSGTDYALDMTLQLENGNSEHSVFNGPLEFIDATSKQAHNLFKRK